jgi:hypothetical protein
VAPYRSRCRIDPEVLGQVRGEAVAVRRSDYYEKFVDRKTDHNKYAFAPDVVFFGSRARPVPSICRLRRFTLCDTVER